MWKYIKPYLPFAILAALFMIAEVSMDLLQPSIMQRIVDDGVLGANNNGVGDINLILRLGIIMICLVLFGGLCGSLNNVFVHKSGQNIGNLIRKDCFGKIMTFSFPQVDKFGTGSLVTRVTNDITQVQNFVATFVRGFIRTFLLTFGSIFFMFRLNTQFGIIVLCAFPIIVGVLALCLWKANPRFSKLQAHLDKINAVMQEDISGIRMIKACVREVYEKLRFNKANDDLIKTQLEVLVIFAFMNPIMNILMNAVVVLILLSGSYQINSGSGATPGNIMAGITYTTQLLNGILMLVMLFQNISRGYASWKRVREILHSQAQLTDGEFDGNTEIKGQIEFKDVSFSYPNSSVKILSNINLSIKQGETVAIMGATGCGKTSLVNLIARFYDVSEGSVLVDGVDVREYKQTALRDKIAVALQKSELFRGSIADNIAWGVTADIEQVKTASQIAQADDFISRMKDGYDTLVAERGMSLSGGQKQRIAIARAVLKNSEILIFDDSTSALDLTTEARLYEALRQSRSNSTKILIAQRIASVRSADRIVILENGTIGACGTHEDLLKSCKTYRDIYDSQMSEEAEKNG
ncbi:MAG: ABC transporter ATP-binding protein/permease [Clostridia bacterium]|nr:ABC transporter ATP-binding protein/permease [Clostridia bacterium]